MPNGWTVRSQEDVDEHGRTGEQSDRGDVSAPGCERLALGPRPDPFHKEDRDRDADDRVVDCQPHGPDPVHVKPPTVPAEGPEVHPARVEERLHREAFLEPSPGTQANVIRTASPTISPAWTYGSWSNVSNHRPASKGAIGKDHPYAGYHTMAG